MATELVEGADLEVAKMRFVDCLWRVLYVCSWRAFARSRLTDDALKSALALQGSLISSILILATGMPTVVPEPNTVECANETASFQFVSRGSGLSVLSGSTGRISGRFMASEGRGPGFRTLDESDVGGRRQGARQASKPRPKVQYALALLPTAPAGASLPLVLGLEKTS